MSTDVVSPPTESHSVKCGAYRRRTESGRANIVEKSKSGPPSGNTLNLYLTGWFVVRPSGSLPVHRIRTEGPNTSVKWWFSTGCTICSVGAIVNDVNEREMGAEKSPRPSGALPVHRIRTEGPNTSVKWWFSTGCTICSVGAIVNDVNEREMGAEKSPRSSTASSTSVWYPSAVWSESESSLSEWNRNDLRFSFVFTHGGGDQ